MTHAGIRPAAFRRLGMAIRDDIVFRIAKLQHARARTVDPALTDHPEHLRDLVRDGIVFVPDVLAPAEVKTIVDEIRTRTDLLTERASPDVVRRQARYLLLNPQASVPSSRAFFENPLVNGLARAYLSRRAVLDRPAVQLKVDVDEPCIVDFFHIDEWRNLISGFLFLDDVGDDQAPMIYLKGSHKPSRWRVAKEKEFFSYYERRADGTYANEESAYCGCFLPTEARRIRERYGFEPVVCTGRAGTLMMFDNLGLHRATPLRRNRRLLLSGYWMLPRRENAA